MLLDKYQEKYLKYKLKYIELKKFVKIGGNIGNKKKLKKKSIEKSVKDNNISINKNKLGGMEPDWTENLSEPWFTLILLGLKTVEGRKNKGRFKEMKVGDIVKWTNNDFGLREVMTRITGKQEYRTFQEYLEAEGLERCLPGIKNIDSGLDVYFKYFTKEDEATYGVIAIRLELV
jgi:ASC-1-like (ASCH) protein